MRQASAFIAGAGSVAALAIGWQVGASALTPPSATPAAQASAAPAASPSATPTPTETATPSPSATAAAPANSSSQSASGSSSSSNSSSSSSSSSSSTSNSSASSGASSNSGITGTFHGQDVAEPRWGGDVQVDVVIKNGKITAVNTVSCNATHGADQACPMLAQEVVSAQSANVSTIGRATYTSVVYLQSVQSALDAAGFKG